MTLEVLRPITLTVMPTTYALREAHAALVAAERTEREFPSRTTGLACDAAFHVLMTIAKRIDPRCIGYPAGIIAWTEDRLTSFPNNAGGETHGV